MLKHWKLLLGLGAGFWAVMFIGVSALIVSPLFDIWQKIIEIGLAAVVSFILAKLYFKKNPGDIKEGLVLALIWLIISAILDLLITIQFVKAGGTYFDGLKQFYGMWSLWISFALTFVACVAAAKTTRGGELMAPTQPPVPPATDLPKY
jgi:hypothetical protein